MSQVAAPAKPDTSKEIVAINLTPTVEAVNVFIEAIKAGLPIGKIFPAKISEMKFTKEHKDQISAARKERKEWCKQNKQRVLKVLGRKSMVADRITERPQRVSVSAQNTAYVKPVKSAK